MKKHKIIKTSAIPFSIDVLLKGQLAFLNNHNFEVIAVSSQGDALKRIEERERVKTIAVEIKRRISLINDLKSLYNLYICFRKEKPDIVHSITPKAGLLSMIAAYFAKVPIRIHTFTGLIFPSKKGFMKKVLIYMDRLTCLFATAVFPEGHGVKKDLHNYKITKKPLKIIANGNVNGIDLSYFNPTHIKNTVLKKELNIKDDDFVYLFVGRLVKDKGINELVEVFSKINSKYSNSKLLLVGPFENDLDPLNSKTLHAIHTNKNIISVGYQHDVRPYFSIADILTFPSYREGFPNVVIQAGAMNLPCIVTNINGCNEIIIHNYNGLIIPPHDTVKLYEAMENLISNKVLTQKLAKNTRILVSEKFNQHLVWNALLKEYQKHLIYSKL